MKNQRKCYDKYYLKFKTGEQTKFMKLIKEEYFHSWKQLADFLGIGRSMVFLYLSEKCKLPKTSFEEMIKVSNLNSGDFLFEIIPYSKYGNAKIPNIITPKLSEFVGIVLGDGHINKTTYQITISCGTVDGLFITEYIPQLINTLFSKHVYFRQTSKHGIQCIFSSKKVCEYLLSDMNISSHKRDSVIPEHFFKNNNLLKSCVKGLFDTDGGLHKHHKFSAQLQFTNKSYLLIQSLQNALIQLGFSSSKIGINHKEKGTYQLYLFGQEVKKYFKEIGSSNPKNNLKFNTWIKEGIVPLNREIIS